MGNRIEISRRGAGARRGKIQKIVCHGFYSRGLTSFAGKGGFAADLGRFGEITLPFFSMGADRAAPSSFFSAPLRLRVSLRPKIGSGVRMVARVTKFVSRLTRSVGGPSRTASDLCKNDSEVMEFVSGQTRGMSELTKCVSRLMKKLSGLTKIISRVTSEVSEPTKKVCGLTEFVSRLTIRDIGLTKKVSPVICRVGWARFCRRLKNFACVRKRVVLC
jgi:hypothetical protein